MNSISPQRSHRLNRKAALNALGRVVRIYWEHEKARPVPDHLTELAAKADEALTQRLDTSRPVQSEERGD
jgi:hypothetical protein